jgi:hypothetical protein
MDAKYKSVYRAMFDGTHPTPSWSWNSAGTGGSISLDDYYDIKIFTNELLPYVISNELLDLWTGKSYARSLLTIEPLKNE